MVTIIIGKILFTHLIKFFVLDRQIKEHVFILLSDKLQFLPIEMMAIRPKKTLPHRFSDDILEICNKCLSLNDYIYLYQEESQLKY